MEKSSSSKKHSFFVRILLPTLITIGLFISAFFIVFIPQFENTIMDHKRKMIEELTNSAWSIIDKWHKAELNGEVTRTEAQMMAKTQIESLRYGEELKDYFWITDFHPFMIMHPYRQDLNNKDLTNFKDS
ncbi:MAG: cache domain-containing protein, partial [Ignavibacteria bacterium]|nr:cache domain-containing protein [Ignavibacteria bacterium]